MAKLLLIIMLTISANAYACGDWCGFDKVNAYLDHVVKEKCKNEKSVHSLDVCVKTERKKIEQFFNDHGIGTSIEKYNKENFDL